MTEPISYDRVVVTLDGSTRSADAVPVGAAVARRFGVPLSYLTVASDHGAVEHAVAACSRFVPHERVDAVASTDVATAILEATDAGPVPALRCMASRGRGGIRGHLFGTVAEEVVRRSAEPTVLVGPSFDPLTFAGVERLLVCTDGSATSERVVPTALRWARTLGIGLELVTVRPAGTEQEVDTVRPRASERFLDDLDVREAAHVRDLAASLADDRVRPTWCVLRDDDPATAIVEHARHRPGTLVAMHTHGRHGAGRIRFGSVTMRVVHAGRTPVLLTGPSVAAGAHAGGNATVPAASSG